MILYFSVEKGGTYNINISFVSLIKNVIAPLIFFCRSKGLTGLLPPRKNARKNRKTETVCAVNLSLGIRTRDLLFLNRRRRPLHHFLRTGLWDQCYDRYLWRFSPTNFMGKRILKAFFALQLPK
jgi:hypothetical protein